MTEENEMELPEGLQKLRDETIKQLAIYEQAVISQLQVIGTLHERQLALEFQLIKLATDLEIIRSTNV